MIKTVFFIVVSLFASFSVSAVTWKDSGYVEITQLYPYDGGLIVYPKYADTSVSSCDNGTRFAIYSTEPNYNVKASLLVAAFMANKKVNLRYDAEQPKICEPLINRFLVKH
ncbi:MAG: hypothetical protein AAGB12_07665 [Pseudomonadota bacterium]